MGSGTYSGKQLQGSREKMSDRPSVLMDNSKDVEVSMWAVIPFLPSCHHSTQKFTPGLRSHPGKENREGRYISKDGAFLRYRGEMRQ